MQRALKAVAAAVALLLVLLVAYGWPPPERKQANESDGFTYFVWPWPSGEAHDPHTHPTPLFVQPALLPSVVDRIAKRSEAITEYPSWFVESQSPDGQFEVRTFADNANDYWYVKNLKTGRMLVFPYGTFAKDPVWEGERLIVDSEDFRVSGASTLHVVVDLDRLTVEEALLLKW